ncbi:mitochondrial fission ELM1 family protein [Alphaproteobacteria bacterium]|nr:mitochondrial fission ELM1 family protein [Alphaproteobacteria bacterium]
MKKYTKVNSWIISDGTKGMENQSLAVAKLLGSDFELINFKPPYLLRKFPLVGKFISTPKIIRNLRQKPLPKFVITTGRRMSGISIAIKSYFKNDIKTIHIQNPKISSKYFDLLLIPEHDKITGKNIIQTKGALSFFLNHEINNKKDLTLQKPVIFLMIGGNNKRYNPQNCDYYELGMKAVHATKRLNAKLIISTSRRTGIKAEKVMKSIFTKRLDDFQLYTFKDKNPYPEILETADFIIVTSDSVNMVSETATISTPLFVSYFEKEEGKILNFLENLNDLGVIKKFEGRLFNYNKNNLNTNAETTLKINKFFRA